MDPRPQGRQGMAPNPKTGPAYIAFLTGMIKPNSKVTKQMPMPTINDIYTSIDRVIKDDSANSSEVD